MTNQHQRAARLRWRRLIAALSAGFLATACAQLPEDSQPRVIGDFQHPQRTETVPSPQDNEDPDRLVRSFIKASADPTQRYQSARNFLTPSADKKWNELAGTLIVDRLETTILPSKSSEENAKKQQDQGKPAGDSDTLEVRVRAKAVGTFGKGGVFRPDEGHADYTSLYTMRKVDGNWRIDGLASGVVFELSDFRSRYEPHDLYFFEPGGTMLVPDRRWVFSEQPGVDSVLMNLLVAGPQEDLRSAVYNEVPNGGTYAGSERSTYRFTGFGELDSSQRKRFAAQVVWTLSRAGVAGPIRIEVDGAPVLDGDPSLTAEQFAEFNPSGQNRPESTNVAGGPVKQAPQDQQRELFALYQDGSLNHVGDAGVGAAPGWYGRAKDIRSVDIPEATDAVAAVTSDAKVAKLTLGKLGEDRPREVLSAATLTRPSFEHGASAVWTVADGQHIKRISPSAEGGKLATTDVPAKARTEDDKPKGKISVLRVAHHGVRAVLIIDGHLYTSVIAKGGDGKPSLVNVREIAPSLPAVALDASLQPDGSVLVATNMADRPVWRVSIDGAIVEPLPAGNITAPVVSITASQNTMYITDNRSTLQLPQDATADAYWREIPGLQGKRSVPVVGN